MYPQVTDLTGAKHGWILESTVDYCELNQLMTVIAASTPDKVSFLEEIIRAYMCGYCFCLCFFLYPKDWQTFSVQGQIVYITGSADHMASVITTQLCHCSMKAATDHA